MNDHSRSPRYDEHLYGDHLVCSPAGHYRLQRVMAFAGLPHILEGHI